MIFEYDKRKSCTNKEKHGIDFEEAKELWKDIELVQLSAKTEHEQRYICIGLINEKYWTAIITYRSEKIRIISVRRSREKEIELYENDNI